MSNLVVSGGTWEASSNPLAFGTNSSTLRFDSSIPGVEQTIAFSTVSQSNAYTSVAPGGRLIIGRFDITAALTGDDTEPFMNRLNINVKVDGKRYPLPIDVQVSVVGGAIAVSLGVQVPFSISFDSFAIKILGLATTTNGDDLSGGAIANPGTTATFFLFAEILETPGAAPNPPSGSTAAPFNSKECFVGDPIDPVEPGIPEVPIIPDPIPIDPIIPLCPIEIDIDPPLPPIVFPPLPVIPPGPPAPGGQGCTPYITAEKQCIETCDGGASDIQIIPYGRCNYHIILFEHCCFNPPPCCEWICCDGNWEVYAGYPQNECCDNSACFDLPKYHLEVYNTPDKNEPPPSGDGGCWYMTDIWDCTTEKEIDDEVGCCTFFAGDGEAIRQNKTIAQCDSLGGIFDETPCEGTETYFQETAFIYTGCGEQGGEALAIELSEAGWATAGPFEGAWLPPTDEDDECVHTVVQEGPPCGDREEGEEREEEEIPDSCEEAPTCPCSCDGQVMKVCDDCTTTPPPPPPCDTDCRYLGERYTVEGNDNYFYRWELVDPCPVDDCCCPTPDRDPESVDDEYIVGCLVGVDDYQCTTTTEAPCTEYEGCTWEVAYDDYEGPYWENLTDDCYEYGNTDNGQNCCCPYPENLGDEYNPRNYQVGDIEVFFCQDESDGYCTTTAPPTGCCLRCQEGQGHGGIVTEDITQAECDELDNGDTVWSPTCPPTICCEVSNGEYETKFEGCCAYNTVDPSNCEPMGCCTYGYANTQEQKTQAECDALGGVFEEGEDCELCCDLNGVQQFQVDVFGTCNATFNHTGGINEISCNCIEIAGEWQIMPVFGAGAGCANIGIPTTVAGTVTGCWDPSTQQWTFSGTVPQIGSSFSYTSQGGENTGDPCCPAGSQGRLLRNYTPTAACATCNSPTSLEIIWSIVGGGGQCGGPP